MSVKREPHEASFAPFTPSSALADVLPHQPSLSVDASTPSFLSHAHGSCYSQPFIAGTASPIRPPKVNESVWADLCLFTSISLLSSQSKPPPLMLRRCSAVLYTQAKLTVWPSLTEAAVLPFPQCFSLRLTPRSSPGLTMDLPVRPGSRSGGWLWQGCGADADDSYLPVLCAPSSSQANAVAGN